MYPLVLCYIESEQYSANASMLTQNVFTQIMIHKSYFNNITLFLYIANRLINININ